MKATLTNDDTTFILGDSPVDLGRLIGPLNLTMSQQTQEVTLLRSEWLTAFPSRAPRVFSFQLPISMPPCESDGAAMMELITVPDSCPRGGILKLEEDGVRVTFAKAWLQGDVSGQNIGVSNLFTYPFRATHPTVMNLVLDETGTPLEDETGAELEY